MIGKLYVTLKSILSGGDEPREQGEYQGLLSYSAEHHAAQHGLYDGLTEATPWKHKMPETPDTAKEPHYYKISYVAGVDLRLVMILAFGAGLKQLI